jgi:hypothetical protein
MCNHSRESPVVRHCKEYDIIRDDHIKIGPIEQSIIELRSSNNMSASPKGGLVAQSVHLSLPSSVAL